mgnify:CR=1 FL=1
MPSILNILTVLCLVEKMKKAFLFPLLISWLIIFAHDVIPHHHRSDIHFNVHNHSDSICVSTQETNLFFTDLDSHEYCSFSVDLLPRFSFDLDILPPELTIINFRENEIIPLPHANYNSFISYSIYLDQRQLRGPPVNLS